MGIALLKSEGGAELHKEYLLNENLNRHDPVYDMPNLSGVARVQLKVSDIHNDFNGNNICSCLVDTNTAVYASTGTEILNGKVIAATFTATYVNPVMNFGTELILAGGALTDFIYVCAIDINKFVVVTQDSLSSSEGVAIVGTVSGNTITLGSPFVFSTVNTCKAMTVCKISTDKFVVAYQDGADKWGYARVGDVTGTNIAFGATWNFAASECWENMLVDITLDHPNKFAIIYRHLDNALRGMIRIATVSGSNIISPTVETDATYSLANDIRAVYSGNNQIIMAYSDSDQGGIGVQAIGDISTGTPVFMQGHQYVYYGLPVSSFSLAAKPDTEPGMWSMIWADTLNNRIGWVQNYYWWNKIYFMRPKHAFEYWPIASSSLIRLGSEFFLTTWTILESYGKEATQATANHAGHYLALKEPIGFMAEDGLAGETKTVDLYGSLHDFGQHVEVMRTYYLDRQGDLGEASHFIMGLGVSNGTDNYFIRLDKDPPRRL